MNTTPTPIKLERVELKSSIDIHLSPAIMDKIKHLCSKVPRLEWSGLLFYTMEGTIRNPAECKITVQDILLMDIGTAGATSFTWDEDIVAYRMDNMEALDWHVGHIHSHNTIDVFFSSTDWSELNDNCPGFNFYLSLIVNNFMDMTAKIAFTADPTGYICKDEEGKDYQMKLTSGNSRFMFVYDCRIFKPAEEVEVPEAFDKRFQDVAAKVAQRNLEEQKRAEAQRAAQPRQYNQNELPFSSFPTFPPDYASRSRTRAYNDYGYDSFAEANKAILEQEQVNDGSLIALEEELNMDALPDADFLAFILRMGTQIEGDDPLEAMEDINLSNLNAEEIVHVIVENYPMYFKKYYEESEATPDNYVKVMDNILSILEIASTEFDFCQDLHDKLKSKGYSPVKKNKKKGGKI